VSNEASSQEVSKGAIVTRIQTVDCTSESESAKSNEARIPARRLLKLDVKKRLMEPSRRCLTALHIINTDEESKLSVVI
jgi:hypothetical protein